MVPAVKRTEKKQKANKKTKEILKTKMQKKSYKNAKIVALFLSLSLLLVTLGSYVPQSSLVLAEEDRITQSDIDKMQEKLDQLAKEQERLNGQLEEAKAQTGQKAALITSYEKVIANYKKDIAATEELIAAYTSLITLKNEELAQKQEEYDRMLRSYKDKLRFTRESGHYTYLQMVFSARNFSEFLSSLFRFGDILDHTNQIMHKLEECAVEIEAMLTELNEAKAAQEVKMIELDAKKADAEQKMAEAEEEKRQLEDDAAALETLIQYYAEQQKLADKALTQLLKDYQSQLKREEDEAKRKEAAKLRWPLDNTQKDKNIYVTSTFGGRIHPVYQRPMNHSGLDLAGQYSGAIANDNIYAARAGQVIIADYNSGYGNYIVIDHGEGMTTVYAHCSKLLVKKGQMVERGQKIALVGSTGTSTGYHLHFEVRLYGEKKDPLDFTYIIGDDYLPAETFVKYR